MAAEPDGGEDDGGQVEESPKPGVAAQRRGRVGEGEGQVKNGAPRQGNGGNPEGKESVRCIEVKIEAKGQRDHQTKEGQGLACLFSSASEQEPSPNDPVQDADPVGNQEEVQENAEREGGQPNGDQTDDPCLRVADSEPDDFPGAAGTEGFRKGGGAVQRNFIHRQNLVRQMEPGGVAAPGGIADVVDDEHRLGEEAGERRRGRSDGQQGCEGQREGRKAQKQEEEQSCRPQRGVRKRWDSRLAAHLVSR